MGLSDPSRATATSDDGTTPPTSPVPSPSSSRDEDDTNFTSETARRRQRSRLAERKSRRTRKTNHERMAAQVKTLECVLANLMFVGDDDAASATVDGNDDWSELVLDDDESTRVRAFLRRVRPLQTEQTRLTHEQRELRQLLRDRTIFEDAFRTLVEDMRKESDWDWRVLRWRALTLASFEHWSTAQCDALVEDTLAHVSGFMANDDVVTTGQCLQGWRDRRRFDTHTSTIEFSFYKTCYGNVDFLNEGLWQLQRPGKAYADVILGRETKVYTEILQEFDANRCLVRVAEQFPESPVVIHMIVLLVRLFVGDACYIVRRTVDAPEVQASLSDADAVWASNFHWTCHRVLERTASSSLTPYLCTTCGSVSSQNAAYARRWLSEALFSVVRAESWIRGTQLLLT